MGQDNGPHTSSVGALIERRPAIIAAVAAGIIALAWFLSRTGGGLAFGPWQGLLLHEPYKPGMPLLSYGLAQLHGLAPGLSAAGWLTTISVIAGAALCALVAWLGAWQACRVTSPQTAMASGVLAGTGATFVPTISYAATGGGPATLTALLGVIVLALIAFAMAHGNAFRPLVLAALVAGLATANHPSMGILALLLLVPYILDPADGKVLMSRLPVLAGAFLLTGLLPMAVVLLRGDTLAGFLRYALDAAYPTLADGRPQLGFGEKLLEELPLLALLAAVPAGKLFFRMSTQQTAVLMAAVFLALGPFLPFLTNEHTLTEAPYDAAAPLALALTAVVMFAAWGVALAAEGVMARVHKPWLKPAAVGMIAALLVTYQAPAAPDRSHGYAETLTQYLLASCPEGSVLVSGDPHLTSLLHSAQTSYGWRDDVTVLAASALVNDARRRHLTESVGDELSLNAQFPRSGAWRKFEHERPLEVRAIKDVFEEGQAEPEVLQDLALWELVRENAHQRAVTFVGLRADWLTARAGAHGGVLHYPRLPEMDESEDLTSLLAVLWTGEAIARDEDMAQTLMPILLNLSDLARQQNELETARELAEWATAVDPSSPEAQLGLTRAAARSGQAELAEKHGAQYLQLGGGADGQMGFLDELKSDLDLANLEKRFESLVEGEQRGLRDLPRRHEFAEPLWQADELALLEYGYRQVLEAHPEDLDALYHYAAVQAQLGRLESAHEVLGKWVRQAVNQLGMTATEIAEALNDDGRFALLRLPTVDEGPAV